MKHLALAMRLMALLIAVALPAAAGAQSPLYINVGEANLKKSLIALPPLQFLGTPAVAKDHHKVGKEIFDTVFNDLSVSGHFEFIRQDAFLEDTAKVGLRPAPGEPGGFNFSNWKQIGTEFLVRAGYKVLAGEVTLETYLYYVPQAKAVLSKSYKGRTADAKVIAHTFANDVVKELTGKKGIFLTKLVTGRSTSPGQKEIFVMDWDGSNPKQISSHKSIALSPTWSPDGKTIAYTAFAYHANEKQRNADLFTYDLASGRRWLVSFAKGINSGATYMPDGNHLLLTISTNGNPDIYRITLDGKSRKAITDGPRGAMNVEPAVSPDGRKIAFSSDRSGRPMIYVMNVDGGGVTRVTFAGEYNSTPSWSPDSKRLAFAGFDKGHFDLFVMNSDGTDMIRLTSAKKPNGKMADNEDPSFSPDGRHILFSSNRTGNNQLYIVDAQGENERRITFDKHEYYKPKWSPYLD